MGMQVSQPCDQCWRWFDYGESDEEVGFSDDSDDEQEWNDSILIISFSEVFWSVN